MKTELIVITGPTASSKTRLAVRVAYHLDGEIISADSRQVYKGMDIGTGKDLHEYHFNGHDIPYHLININEAGETYNLHEYQRDFKLAYDDIIKRKKTPVMCGGTGLYIEAVLKGYNYTAIPVNEDLRNELVLMHEKSLHARLNSINDFHITFDTSTKKRLMRAIEICEYLKQYPEPTSRYHIFDYKCFCIDVSRKVILQRIKERLYKRVETGLIEEVEYLLQSGVSSQQLKYYGLEYKYVMEYLEGTMRYSEMLEKLNVAIRQYAKRQMTWLRRMERHGFNIIWINGELDEGEVVQNILQHIYV